MKQFDIDIEIEYLLHRLNGLNKEHPEYKSTSRRIIYSFYVSIVHKTLLPEIITESNE